MIPAVQPFSPPAQRLAAAVGPLLCWYDGSARQLPWRENPTPYRVWISEVMLQQTRVEAVRPYFARFVAALPDEPALALADDALLLKLWEGLGYYSRVRNLKKAAEIVVDRHGGALPADYDALRALPGIGEYSAGAIASIAFGIRAAAVDANVLRVVSRLLASEEDITRSPVKKKLTALVRDILPERRIGDFNQSLMELGATVCLPNGAPLCKGCPVGSLCEGFRLGRAGLLPVKAAKKPRRVQQITVFLITIKRRIALRRRPLKGLLAGLWELPNAEGALSADEAAHRLVRWGISALKIAPAQPARHIFTHIEWHIQVWRVEAESLPLPDGWVLADDGALDELYALPSAFSQLLL
jgi:A/G-specific adenine glycosylase